MFVSPFFSQENNNKFSLIQRISQLQNPFLGRDFYQQIFHGTMESMEGRKSYGFLHGPKIPPSKRFQCNQGSFQTCPKSFAPCGSMYKLQCGPLLASLNQIHLLAMWTARINKNWRFKRIRVQILLPVCLEIEELPLQGQHVDNPSRSSLILSTFIIYDRIILLQESITLYNLALQHD